MFDPVSIIITIGAKYLGVGKVLTAIKLVVAGKKVAGAVALAKGAIIEEAIVHGIQDSFHDDLFVKPFSDANVLFQPVGNTVFYNPLENTPSFELDDIDAFDGINDIPDFYENDFQDFSYDELLLKVKEIYGEDAYIRTIGQQIGDIYTPISFSDDLFPYVLYEDILSPGNFDPIEPPLPYSDVILDDETVLGSTGYPSEEEFLNPPSYSLSTIEDIMNSYEYTDIQKEEIIFEKLTIHYEAITSDYDYKLTLSMHERIICDHFPDFFKENQLTISDKEILESLSDKNNSRTLIKRVAEIIEEYKDKLEDKSLNEKMYMALFILSAKPSESKNNSLSEPEPGLYSRKEKKKKPEKKPIKPQATIDSPKDKTLKVSKNHLKELVSKNKLERVFDIFILNLPSSHEMCNLVVSLRSRKKRNEQMSNSDLITNEEYSVNLQRINNSLLALIDEYFNEYFQDLD